MASNGGHFTGTRWSLVLAAADGQNNTRSRRALDELVKGYWPPLYSYIRHHGHGQADAEDLTQEFLARLLEKKDLASVDPAKGKFRSFLLASLKHFLANEWDKQRAKKRGGGRRVLSIDTRDAEDRYRAEPVDNVTPELLFTRHWALALLDQVLSRLRQEYKARSKEPLFEGLKKALTGELDAPSYAQLAAQLKMDPNAVKVAAHRLRQRYRDVLRDEISQTVADRESLEEEIRDLFNCL
jgi:RNA polymerase sigma-70 factor (ECF subfamily)